MKKMKSLVPSLIASISAFFLSTSIAFADDLPKPDFSVWNSANMKPIHDFANITIGVIFGIAVLYAVVMIAYYGIKLQSSGSDLLKSQDAKNGLKGTIVGVITTFSAIFVVGIILYVLGIVGIKN